MLTLPRETLLCRYHYDPLDRLIDCAVSNQANLLRFYCESRLANEIQGAKQTRFFQHDNQLLAQQQRQDNAQNTWLLATDSQRSVLKTLRGAIDHPIAYTPYGHGKITSHLGSLLGFKGERADPITGHYPLGSGYRVFNPVLMRFNSPDSWSPFGAGGINSYLYCLADPVNRVDRDGHISTPSPRTVLPDLWRIKSANSTTKFYTSRLGVNASNEKTLKKTIMRNETGSGWTELTSWPQKNGDARTRMAEGSWLKPEITVTDNKSIRTIKNNNPTLLELAFNQTPGKLLIKPKIHRIPYDVDDRNLENYKRAQVAKLLSNWPSAEEREALSARITEHMEKGLVLGVRPKSSRDNIRAD
ncbi:RHS repeat-associated core domain-containing protein [Pseudomonas asplenii]|uniref:RHS repeat-associated core domain-containing protein n=1 Tax=Pseudomonas asplenii TaxID=53407 RepID=UPI00236251FD|nr:RHS repeat-associated core domain-containing protein [Pseudomonas asplenii]